MLLKKDELPILIKDLKKLYPKTKTALNYGSAFQLLCAVILSAQCTDARVNMVTPKLFAKYPDAKTMSHASLQEIETIIKSTGFYHAKAKSLSETSKALFEQYQGEVPADMQKLLKLRGVARKTANVVLQDFYGIAEGVVVDTHVKRLSYRIGLSKNSEPLKIERDLMKLLDKKYWHWISHALIWHGRGICHARGPKCEQCPLASYCPKNGVKTK
ncbi:endonuclease III [Candidatus Proelusimicrobium volucris]|uniref:endonuclease III n=1 Tax=Candidatus Proelusimicrobium volucris TaxID=3416225 RepID=UPI003D12BAC0